MSVSLVVYRLEIADSHTFPEYLSYQSSKYKQQNSITEVDTDKRASGFNASTKSVAENSLSRGKRQFTELKIITLKDENLNVEAKMKSGDTSAAVTDGDGDRDKASADKEEVPGSKKTVSDYEQIEFVSGNPNVDVTRGMLHLYKENEMTSLKDDVLRSEMVCLLGVPAKFSISELLSFITPVSSNITHLRIVKDAKPNYYMVLVKFRCQEYADEFYKAYNGARFNSLEEDVCHLVYIAKVEVSKESECGCLPLGGLTELPQCNICLERMDESVDGILTILCNHTFHSKCLLQWEDTTCPVCRYYQTPEEAADSVCSSCDRREDLWICLICGVVGCGRYTEGHAYNHFQATQHTYSMELSTNRVWDYAGDNYVHRLIQSRDATGSKMVQYEPSESKAASGDSELKMDSITLEYTYLLTSQLEQQRCYFEEMMQRLEQEAKEQREQTEASSKKTIAEYKKLEVKYSAVCKDKEGAERKCSQLQAKVDKTGAELGEERELNKYLQENQADWQDKVKGLEAKLQRQEEKYEREVGDLKEQLRDVMFFLEAQNKLQESESVTQEELEGSQVVLGDNNRPGGSGAGGATGNSGKSRRGKGKR